MKSRLLISTAVTVLLLSACSDDIDTPTTTSPSGKQPMQFSAAMPSSKTTLTDTNAVVWTAGDAISVFGTADTDNNLFSLSSGSGTSSAVFSGTITAGSTSYWAIYPYSASNSFDATSSTLTITLPQNQSYAADSFATDVNPMAAVGTGSSLAFMNLCGLLKFQMTGNTAISQIIVYDASGMPLSGSAEVTFSGGMPSLTMTEINSLPVVIDCGTAGVELSSTATDFYAVVPPRSFTSGLQVVIIDTSNQAMVTNIAPTSVSRAAVRTLPSIAYTIENVTYYGSENCYQYVASAAAQSQSIDTTPYITSEYSIPTGTLAVTDPSFIDTTDSASIIWQDNSALLSNVVFNNNSISFTIGASQSGNALIGLYDSDGTVLWSYHIWVTSTAVENDFYTNGYTLMDRNLGATTATGSPGLYYQWGRKEPFRNTDNTIVTGPQTVAYAIANPTSFITASGIESWYIDEYISLWGNPFGYTALPENEYLGTKTIYDPCPEGYQVAAPAVFADFSSANLSWNGNGGSSTLTSGNAWYPAAGFLTSTDGLLSSNSSAGFYWSNSPFDYFDYTGSLSYIGSCSLNFSQTNVSPAEWMPAAAAASVRCMAMQE